MSKIIEKWWVLIATILLGVVFVWGVQNMYFHQDDLDWFIIANRPFWQVIAAPLSDHINYLFRLLLKFEWDYFRLFFPSYLFVSVVMHAVVIWLLYYLARLTSQRDDLAAIVAVIFAVNTNWTEVVLWISGQTISISVIFVLLAMIFVWHKKNIGPWVGVATLTSALALGLLPATLLSFGIDYKSRKLKTLGIWMIMLGILVLLIYKYLATDGTQIEYSLTWAIQVIGVMGLAIVNTVFGRLFLPFDRFEILRIMLVSLVTISIVWKERHKLLEILKDKWSIYLALQIFFYYLIVAVGRAQYGVGIMRAERYAYMGLALILLLSVRILRKTQVGKWVWVVPYLVIVQCIGLLNRAENYIVRPTQLKALVREVQNEPTKYNKDDYLPHFVLNDERLKYGDLMKLLGD